MHVIWFNVIALAPFIPRFEKDQSPIATEGSFDKISHLLLPKQVTPFLIRFPNVSLSDVGSIRMTPFSSLVAASADPVIEIQDEHLNPAPDASVTGQLTNQSGQPGINVFGQRGVVPIAGVPNERRFIQFALKVLF